MSNLTFEIIRGTAILMMFTAAVIFFLYRWLKGSRDPAALLFRWLLTGAALFALGYGVVTNGTDGSGQLFSLMYALVGGLFLAVVWVPVVIDFVSRKIGSLYDGGDAEVEPKPFYSIFLAKRSQGKYHEALAEVRRQLDKFPTDFEGQMLLAELQAENLNDLPGAEITIQRLCAQPGHLPVNIADALNRLADWHLKLMKDPAAARETMEKIIQMLPNTEQALVAAQRIARLTSTEALLAPHQRTGVHVAKGVENLGLLTNQEHLQHTEADPAQVASDYVQNLSQHPLDTHAREKLALIYAQHYHRLDLALDQLEQLVQQPNHPPKQVVHWLNLMADIQVQEAAEPELVRATLQRIIDQFPDLAAAASARRRMDTLRLELKKQDQGRQVRLGVYDQNIGLQGTSLPPGEKPSFTPIK